MHCPRSGHMQQSTRAFLDNHTSKAFLPSLYFLSSSQQPQDLFEPTHPTTPTTRIDTFLSFVSFSGHSFTPLTLTMPIASSQTPHLLHSPNLKPIQHCKKCNFPSSYPSSPSSPPSYPPASTLQLRSTQVTTQVSSATATVFSAG